MATPTYPVIDNNTAEKNSSNVRSLIRPFDPESADAEARYDEVVLQVNRARLRRIATGRELAELERQFIDNDLDIETDGDVCRPLGRGERRRRLSRMLELNLLFVKIGNEERIAVAHLERMNNDLDRWAREAYGG